MAPFTVSLYVPGEHGVGVEEPAPQKKPAGQTVQFGLATPDENVPAGQVEQISAPNDEHVPTPQAFRSIASRVAFCKQAYPARHAVQLDAALSEKKPGLHGVHATWPGPEKLPASQGMPETEPFGQ